MRERYRWCLTGVLAGMLIMGAGAVYLEAQPPLNQWSRVGLKVDWGDNGPIRAKRWEVTGDLRIPPISVASVEVDTSIYCRGRLLNDGAGQRRVKVGIEMTTPSGQQLEMKTAKTNRDGEFFFDASDLPNATDYARDNLINGTLIRNRLYGRNRRPITAANAECGFRHGSGCRELPDIMCLRDRFQFEVSDGGEPYQVFQRSNGGGIFTNFRSDVNVHFLDRCGTNGDYAVHATVSGPDQVQVMATDVLTGDMALLGNLSAGDDQLATITGCP